MASGTFTLKPALLAALETCLLVLPLGVLLFFPFIQEYEFLNWESDVLYSGGLMLAFSCAISFAILVPATTLLQMRKRDISLPELGASLSSISLALVLGGTLIYNRFSKPGAQGKLLLFGLLMALMVVTWVFTVRYTHRRKGPSTALNT